MQNTKESKLITILNKIENTLGGLKCAVTLILIFTVGMVVGTFFESYYGTEFAGKTIYKTWWFMSIQGLMFLSIVFATFRRLPPKKRLYGFYTIHLGLILVGCGSFVTYYAGVDGSILLQPNTPAREIILPQDVLKTLSLWTFFLTQKRNFSGKIQKIVILKKSLFIVQNI